MSAEQDAIKKLRMQITQGFEQIEQGQYTEYASAKEFAKDIKAEGRKRLEARGKQAQP